MARDERETPRTNEEWDRWAEARVKREFRFRNLGRRALAKFRMHKFIKLYSTKEEPFWLTPEPETLEPWGVVDFQWKDVPIVDPVNDDERPRYLRIYGENRCPVISDHDLTFGDHSPEFWFTGGRFEHPEDAVDRYRQIYRDRYECEPPAQFSPYLGEATAAPSDKTVRKARIREEILSRKAAPLPVVRAVPLEKIKKPARERRPPRKDYAKRNVAGEIKVWCEGYSTSGQSGRAWLIVTLETSRPFTLREACDAYAERVPEFDKYYCPQNLTFWGCRLFDNEADARKAFG